MAKESRKKRRMRRNPMADLTDDLIVEILSRLPVRSLCHCKGVSRHWRRLISCPHHRRKLSQTLPGIFYSITNFRCFPRETRHFTHVWEGHRDPLICPSLSFVPGYEHIRIVDGCNGMLLCHRLEGPSLHVIRYVVCNPANKRLVVLPDSGCDGNSRVTRLAFDPALYPDFHVFEFVVNDDGNVEGVNIYSSKTGEWRYKESEWTLDTSLSNYSRCVFYNGFLHLVNFQFEVLAIDVEGERWSMIPLPEDAEVNIESVPGFIGQYKGHLCYINKVEHNDDLSIWVLEDKDEWTLKHQVNIQKLCEKRIGRSKSMYYHVITILPDCNYVLYVAGCHNTLMAYDIDREEVHVIQNLGQDSWEPYIPYVPFYTD